jgi:hypothetical protein
MILFINNKEVNISKVMAADQYKWVKIYVNDYASVHSLPVANLSKNCTFFTGGNKYQVVIN